MDEIMALRDRISKLVDACGTMTRFADLVNVSQPTVKNWLRGTTPYESNLRDIIERTGVSEEWLREGAGRDDAEIKHFKSRLHAIDASGGPRQLLRGALQRAHMTPAELARRIGYQAGPVQAVLERGSRISEGMAKKISEVIPELDAETLMSGSDTPRVMDESGTYGTFGSKPRIKTPAGMSAKLIPLIAFTQAGASINYEDDTYECEGITAFNVSDPHAFATQVRGDSMEPRIKEGDILVVTPSATVRNGDVVLVRLHSGDVMCKVYQAKDNGRLVVLSSYNHAHPPIEVSRNEIAKVFPVQSVIQTLRRPE